MSFFEKKFLEVYKPCYLGVILAGTFVDLVTKYWVIMNYSYNEPVDVWGNLFRMTLIFNTGFVFGLFQDNAIPSLVATGIAILFLIGYRWKNHEMGNPWGWNMVMMGALGNFIDKFFVKIPPGGGVRFGFTPGPGEFIGVVDFFDFDWPDFLLFYRWPAFNIADSCVSIGLLILIFTMNTKENKK